MGAEKFFDIKCRASGLAPDAAVVVATVRALKMHGGVGKIVAGKPLDPALLEENVEAVRTGASNLAAQIEIVRALRHPGGRRHQLVPDRHAGRGRGDPRGRPGRRRARRGRGHPLRRRRGRGDATSPRRCGPRPRSPTRDFRLLYPDEAPLGEKIETIVTEIYGGDGIELPPAAKKQLKQYEDLGYGHLPVCMAKTQYSLSHDADAQGPAVRLHRADPRDPPVGRRRVHHADLRRDADDARAAVQAGRREHRHRRRRERRRPVLARLSQRFASPGPNLRPPGGRYDT